MRNTITALCLILIASGSLVYGQSNGTSSNYGGNTTYHTFNDGTTGSSSNYGGNTTYHSFDSGLSGSSSNYGGNTTYHNLNNGW